MEDLGGMGGVRGGTIGHVQDSTVGGRRGEAFRPLDTDRSGRERRRIDQRAVSEEAAEVVTGAATETVTATVTETATDATMMTEGEWENYPATRGLGQDQGQDLPWSIVRKRYRGNPTSGALYTQSRSGLRSGSGSRFCCRRLRGERSGRFRGDGGGRNDDDGNNYNVGNIGDDVNDGDDGGGGIMGSGN